jgi:hypothetical protein
MNKNLGPRIIELHQQGKTYREIKNELKCSLSTICYHCGKGQKNKNRIKNTLYRKKHPYIQKIQNFNLIYKTVIKSPVLSNSKILYLKFYRFASRGLKLDKMITLEEVVQKFGENPVCYLTGVPIDISQPRTYHFDHIVPVSKGGTNSLDNLGICTKQANLSKTDMTKDEFILFCRKVIQYQDSMQN